MQKKDTSSGNVSLECKIQEKSFQAQKLTPTLRLILFYFTCKGIIVSMGDGRNCILWWARCWAYQLAPRQTANNYIDEGDGFLADSICQDGYIMNFFFRNFPHQSIMLTKDTLQHMLMCCSFLTCLRKKSHGWARQFVHEGIVSMGCLYWKNQVKIHGVVHKSGRGVPGCVLQETKKSKWSCTGVGNIQGCYSINVPMSAC